VCSSDLERKAVVADKRKGRDLAYAPTGTSLEAGKLVKQSEFEAMMARRSAPAGKPASSMLASTSPRPATAPERMRQDRQPAQIAAVPQSAGDAETTTAATTTVPIPEQNPLAYAAPPIKEKTGKKPFWKFWAAE